MGIYEKINDRAISFDDWKKAKGYNSDDMQNWKEYWEEIMQPEYTKEYYGWIDKLNSRIFFDMLFQEHKFFNNVYDYMKKTNWTWGDSDVSPTIDEMKNSILSLAYSGKGEGGEVSSGGFNVDFLINHHLNVRFAECEYPKTEITIFESCIKINDVRMKKLGRVLK